MSTTKTRAAPGRAPVRSRSERPVERHSPLRGPIPLEWLSAAARLPGRSLHAGIALWHTAGTSRSVTVPLSNISSVRFGLDRNSKYRALGWLENAGLITVERNLGRTPVITILTRDRGQ